MRRPVLIITVFCLTLACDRYPDPYVDLLKNYSFSYETNQGMRFFAGEWVSDSIKFRAVDNNAPFKDSIRVLFEVAKGGGQLTVSSGYTDTNGYIYTGWKLGSGSFEQILRANTYDLAGNYLNSSDLVAYGFRANEWDTLTDAYFEAGITGMAADTVNKITLMVNRGMLFRQGERYYIWEQAKAPFVSSLRTIDIDKNGIFYVSIWDGDLFKSIDHGETWVACTRPYPQGVYNIYVTISNDNYIWVSSYNNTARYSKDQGETWFDTGIEYSYYGYGDVFRLKDGSLLLQGSDCCSLLRSFDEGVTWVKVESPGYLKKLYVNDSDEIIICVSPFTLYKSTDYGITFSHVYGINPDWGSVMEDIFLKVNNFYYILVPGWGILKSTDLTIYDIYWINFNLRDLFIDHSGVLIGTYWNWQSSYQNTVYYRKNSEK